MSLYQPSTLLAFLNEQQCFPKKSLSQNFLIDGNILRKIVECAEVNEGDSILEIGPGPGALTEALLQKGARVQAIEKDRNFAELLMRLQKGEAKLEVHCQDALTFPYEELAHPSKIVANLPYNITTPFLVRTLPLHQHIPSLTVMVQKEVAERICAEKNTSEYGSLTLFTQVYSSPRIAFIVKPTCFYPRPSVDSAIVHFTLHAPQERAIHPDFNKLIRTAFQGRRKMLRVSLKAYGSEKIEKTLADIGINPQARPQELSLSDFLALFERL